MGSKKAALKQPASPEHSGPQSPTTAKMLGERVRSGDEGPSGEDRQTAYPDPAFLITDEVLRHRIRSLIEEKPAPSWLHRFLNHQLFLTAIGFLLTGVIGGFLTYYYGVKQKDLDYHRALQQQELASQRSFSDELNKMQVQRIGEVWEQVDKNEVLLDDLLEKADKAANAEQKNQAVDAINNLIQEDRIVINKNRFWIGEQYYNRFQDYLDKNVRIALNVLLAHPGTDFSGIIGERKRVKQDILQIRESMRSEGQPAR